MDRAEVVAKVFLILACLSCAFGIVWSAVHALPVTIPMIFGAAVVIWALVETESRHD